MESTQRDTKASITYNDNGYYEVISEAQNYQPGKQIKPSKNAVKFMNVRFFKELVKKIPSLMVPKTDDVMASVAAINYAYFEGPNMPDNRKTNELFSFKMDLIKKLPSLDQRLDIFLDTLAGISRDMMAEISSSKSKNIEEKEEYRWIVTHFKKLRGAIQILREELKKSNISWRCVLGDFNGKKVSLRLKIEGESIIHKEIANRAAEKFQLEEQEEPSVVNLSQSDSNIFEEEVDNKLNLKKLSKQQHRNKPADDTNFSSIDDVPRSSLSHGDVSVSNFHLDSILPLPRQSMLVNKYS